MTLKIIGVIGSGQMGSGIVQVSAMADYQVVMYDIAIENMDKAKASIAKNLDRLIQKEQITALDKENILGRISCVTHIDGLANCDLVIEAASEKEEIKKKIFQSVSAILKSDAYIVTNTSSISITRLAGYTDRPEKFMGVHFMNPVPKMQLVELIRGIATVQATVDIMQGFIDKLGKTSAHAEDFPGFIVNRVLIPMINEAIYTLYEGVGSVKSIDNCMRLGANHPMGPLELADFIGLDTCLAIMQVLNEGLADTKYRPCPLLVKYVEAGWLGRKTGKGFYDYSTAEPTPTR